MKRFACVTCLLLVSLLSACRRDAYQVRMRYEGSTLHRELTVEPGTFFLDSNREHSTVPHPPGRFAALEKLYAKKTHGADPNVHIFSGRFRDKLPDDVGNSGTFTHFGSTMGDLAFYIERFRGDDDAAGAILRQFHAVDKLVDLTAGYLESRLGKKEGFDKLRTFLDRELRRDAKNVLIYLRRHGGVGMVILGESSARDALLARLFMYFYERKYFRPKDLPQWIRLLNGGDWKTAYRQDGGTLVRQFLTVKVGLREGKLSDAMVDLLADPNTLRSSFLAHVAKTEGYQATVEQWRQRGEKDPNDKGPTPEGFVQGHVGDLYGPVDSFPFQPYDELQVEFAAETQPFKTNGQWDAKRKLLRWQAQLPLSDTTHQDLPTLCYALWAQPNRTFQKAHFAKVVLAGEKLFNYCLWRKALTPAEARKWDAFLASLRPGADLRERLERFRLAEDRHQKGVDHAAGIIETILSGLKS